MERLGGARRPRTARPATDPAIRDRDPAIRDPAIRDPAISDPAIRGPAIRGQRLEERPGFAERILITLSGIRQPIVAILLLISFFTVISGKPLDGLLLAVVATALAWDAGMRARELAMTPATGEKRPAATRYAGEASGPAWAGNADAPAPAADPGGLLTDEPAPRPAWRPRTGRPRARNIAIGGGTAVCYALIVGSFTRYSWPATAGVAGLGAGVVIVGWGGPTRKRQVPGKFARRGVLAWGSLLVVGGLWELAALLGQPTPEQSSYAHPTISTLTDPLLGSSLGRTVALLGWIGLGAFLVER